MIKLLDIHKAFGPKKVLEGFSLEVKEGETMVIIGYSGTGKSVAIKHMVGLLEPDRGSVFVDGQEVPRLSRNELYDLRSHIGYVFQFAALFDSLSICDNVAMGLRKEGKMSESEILKRVGEAFDLVDLPGVEAKFPAELSGGMRKRVGIARGMANNAKIMLYDEPTSGLDPLTTATVTHLIMKLQKELNVTSIVVSHDIRSSFRMGTKIELLAERRIVYFGTPEEMRKQDDEYIRKFLGGY